MNSTQINYSISFEVEYTFAKLLAEEFKLIQNLQVVNNELSKRYDFNAVTLFSLLDDNECGNIKSEQYIFTNY